MISLKEFKKLDEVLPTLTSTSKVGISCLKVILRCRFIISHPLLIFPQLYFCPLLKEAISSNWCNRIAGRHSLQSETMVHYKMRAIYLYLCLHENVCAFYYSYSIYDLWERNNNIHIIVILLYNLYPVILLQIFHDEFAFKTVCKQPSPERQNQSMLGL